MNPSLKWHETYKNENKNENEGHLLNYQLLNKLTENMTRSFKKLKLSKKPGKS